MDPSHLKALSQTREHLISRAQEASQYANSYRDFQVGSAVLAFNPQATEPANSYHVFVGANLKPAKDGPKVCAEQIAIGSAIANGYSVIIALAVTGERQPDSKSGLNPPTLHPCWECRTLLRDMPQVSDDTFIITTFNHGGPVEEHTMAEILAIHND